MRIFILLLRGAIFLMFCQAQSQSNITPWSSLSYEKKVDQLWSQWSFYKFSYMQSGPESHFDGQVRSLDENNITTSEAQSYAMLRAVWLGDRTAFYSIWKWTKENLQREDDFLFSWKYHKNKIVDSNSALDADVDIALALILAYRQFQDTQLLTESKKIMDSIWEKETAEIPGVGRVGIAGNWNKTDAILKIHVGYFAPAAYTEFSRIDKTRDWNSLTISGYKLLDMLIYEKQLSLPPEVLFIQKKTGKVLEKSFQKAKFSYDTSPLLWRLALDRRWNSRGRDDLLLKLMSPLKEQWASQKYISDAITIHGKPLTQNSGLPQTAAVYALASELDKTWANQIQTNFIQNSLTKTTDTKISPYYFQNWLWFALAFEAEKTVSFDEFLLFLRPFKWGTFSYHFPTLLISIFVVLIAIVKALPLNSVNALSSEKRESKLSRSILFLAFAIFAYFSLDYLIWRLFYTLNSSNLLFSILSFLLWTAEVYAALTVFFLYVQLSFAGFRRGKLASILWATDNETSSQSASRPSVDILIPIYSEPLNILRHTLISASRIEYPSFKIFVCDDSHRPDVETLTQKYGAVYIKGPKKHAKAGNLNNAMTLSSGELILILDTDHIPRPEILIKLVPYFNNRKLGFVQLPHIFFNDDIFQRAFHTKRGVGNESDMFHKHMQPLRNRWGGAIFSGSGTLFQREAIEQIGGFKTLSITEDIHTSQSLHALGLQSEFHNENLIVGLDTEDFSGFVVQRSRWMQGCLQIFFKDNPLFKVGLSWKHKAGYFASYFHFFFPIFKVFFWLSPLLFLFFHMYPLVADVSILAAKVLPFIVGMLCINLVMMKSWPRFIWSQIYETSLAYNLFFDVLAMCLPKKLSFKVTPKGLTSQKRTFNWTHGKVHFFVWSISGLALLKGAFEFAYFGIEKDAYFFNLIWASVPFLILSFTSLVLFESPQRRKQHRIVINQNISIEQDAQNSQSEIAKNEDVLLIDVSLGGGKLLCATEMAMRDDSLELKVFLKEFESLQGVNPILAKSTRRSVPKKLSLRLKNFLKNGFSVPGSLQTTSSKPIARPNQCEIAFCWKNLTDEQYDALSHFIFTHKSWLTVENERRQSIFGSLVLLIQGSLKNGLSILTSK